MNFDSFTKTEGGISAPAEFTANNMSCGLSDIGLLYSNSPCDVVAVFSNNKFISESLKLTGEHIKKGKINAIFFNNGNSNSCRSDGIHNAETIIKKVSEELAISEKSVAICSSGLIGIQLKVERICEDIPMLVKGLSANKLGALSHSICDEKNSICAESACSYKIDNIVCKTGVIIKKTNKAESTVSSYTCIITTDTSVDKQLMQRALEKVYPLTTGKLSSGFDSVSDITMLISSGFSGNKTIMFENSDYDIFMNSLYYVLSDAIKHLIKNQGTKLIEWVCINANDEKTAENIVNKLIVSDIRSVFSDEIFSDLLSSLGTIESIPDINRIDISIKTADTFEKILIKGIYTDFDTYKISDMLNSEEVKIIIDLNDGESSSIFWSDF